MRIGTTPGPMTGDAPIDDYIEDAKRLEEMGFATLWMPEVLGADPFVLLTVLSRETSRIRLGTAVAQAQPRHPAVMAKEARTLSAVSGGRFSLGLGPSHEPVIEFMFGMSYARPAARMREYLRVVRELTDTGATGFDGEFYRVNIALRSDAGDVELLLSALAPRMLALAGELADGNITWMTTPKYLRETVMPQMKEAAGEADREPPRLVAGFPVCVTDDVAEARTAAARKLDGYGHVPAYRRALDAGGAGGPEDVAIVGDVHAVATQLRELAEIGVDELWAVVFSSGTDRAASIARTREVLMNITV